VSRTPSASRRQVNTSKLPNGESSVGLFNPGSLAVTVTVSQLDLTGSAVTSAPSLSVASGGQMTAYVPDLFPGVTGTQGFRLSVELRLSPLYTRRSLRRSFS
jgi:hypothetical protein